MKEKEVNAESLHLPSDTMGLKEHALDRALIYFFFFLAPLCSGFCAEGSS